MAKQQREQTAHSRRSIRTDSEKYHNEKERWKTRIYLHILISQSKKAKFIIQIYLDNKLRNNK
jgi:hypothetical protein